MKCKFCDLEMINNEDEFYTGYYCETLHYIFGSDGGINEYITINTSKYIMHSYIYDERTHVFIINDEGLAGFRFFVPKGRILEMNNLTELQDMLDKVLVLI